MVVDALSRNSVGSSTWSSVKRISIDFPLLDLIREAKAKGVKRISIDFPLLDLIREAQDRESTKENWK